MTLFSYLKGLLLGSTVTFLSYLFDITVSRNSLSIVLQKQGSLYKKGWNMIIFNMLGIAPIVYTIIHDNMIVVNTWTIEPVNIICILAIHSYGYYTVHKAMHENRYLYKFTSFITCLMTFLSLVLETQSAHKSFYQHIFFLSS